MSRPQQTEGYCRSCGARIWWAMVRRKKDGKMKPLPVDWDPHPEGDLLLSKNTQTGQVSGIYQAVGSDPKLRQSHFKTCPEAANWSKKGKEKSDGGSDQQG